MNEEIQKQILELTEHNIPFYAYGDNEAACELSRRLIEVASIVNQWVFIEKSCQSKQIKVEAKVKTEIAEIDKLPMWTEIYVQPLDVTDIEGSKVYWLKHPQIKPKTFYDKDFAVLVNEFIEFWENT